MEFSQEVKDHAAEVIGRLIMKAMDLAGVDTLPFPEGFSYLSRDDRLAVEMAQMILKGKEEL